MRAISATRSSSRTSCTVVDTLSADGSPPLLTTNWASAQEATCARWVTTMTCATRASRASRRPSSTADLPPTPASTSSKMKVMAGWPGRAEGSSARTPPKSVTPALSESVSVDPSPPSASGMATETSSVPYPMRRSAATSSNASISRLSSPPDALLPIGSCGEPGNGVNRNAMSSRPLASSGHVPPRASSASRGVTRISNPAPDIASEDSSSPTRADSSPAARRRTDDSLSAASSASSNSRRRSCRSSASFSGEVSRSSTSSTALSRQAITSARVGPQRRVSSSSSWMRPLIASRSSTPSSISIWRERLNTTSDRSAPIDSRRSARSENGPSTWMARRCCTARVIRSEAPNASGSPSTAEASNAPSAPPTPWAISAAFSMRLRRILRSSSSPGCGSTRLMRSIDSRR